jgi:hypothetical protein
VKEDVMSTDPNIAEFDPNGCLWIDPTPPNPYWLSPSVIMTTKPSDPSDVYPGANSTSVTVSWKAECAFAGVAAELNTVVFDLYIGDPFLGMAETSLGSLTGGSPAQPNITAGQSNVVTSVGPWDSSTIPHLSQPHHACLLARVYPFGATPDTGDLSGYPGSDQHYAQHNCTVNTTDGQGMIRIPIGNGTSRRGPQLVAIQAVPVLDPNRAVLDAVLPSLQLHPGFKQISTTPLRVVNFDLSAFKSPHESLLDKIENWIEKKALEVIKALEGDCKKANGISARVVLPPNLFAKFDFIADLSGAKPGDAHIYNVSQVNSRGEPFGGLTVAVLVT